MEPTGNQKGPRKGAGPFPCAVAPGPHFFRRSVLGIPSSPGSLAGATPSTLQGGRESTGSHELLVSAGRGSADSSDNLPEALCEEYCKTAVSCQYSTLSHHFRREACLKLERFKKKKKKDTVVLASLLVWCQHRVSLSLSALENAELLGGVCACARRGLRVPETSGRSAWQSYRTAPGHRATFWTHPR